MLISSKYIELRAPFKATQQTQVVQVKNDTNASMAFKVKTTAPKLYCVRPNSGVLVPGASEPVTIIFQGLPEEPALGSKCKDKFLFVSVPAPDDLIAKDVSSKWSELEKAANGNSIDVKLKVVFNYDNPMNTITEEEKSAHSIETPQSQSIKQQENINSSSISKNITESKQRVAAEEKSKPTTTEKESHNELKPSQTQTTKSAGIAPPTIAPSVNSNQTTIYFIAIIFIILAFLLSRFI